MRNDYVRKLLIPNVLDKEDKKNVVAFEDVVKQVKKAVRKRPS